MKLIEMRPMIWVRDVEATINYYKTMLGFTEGHFEKEQQWGWVRRDGIEIMFAKPNQHSSYDGASFTDSFYFNVDNADEWYGNLKDCNGYILQFGHELQ